MIVAMEIYYLSFDSDSYGNMMVDNSHPVIVQKTHLIPLIYRLSTQFSLIKYVKSTKCMNYTRVGQLLDRWQKWLFQA
jgi:hypothetical protein